MPEQPPVQQEAVQQEREEKKEVVADGVGYGMGVAVHDDQPVEEEKKE